MRLTDDLMNLSPETKKRLLRITDRLIHRFPDICAIIIQGVSGVERPVEPGDFEVHVLFKCEENEENEENKDGGDNSTDGIISPGMGYERREAEIPFSKTDLLPLFFKDLTPELSRDFLAFLERGLNFFEYTDRSFDFPDIITLDIPEMMKDNFVFYKLYQTNAFDDGYLAYSRDLKPGSCLL